MKTKYIILVSILLGLSSCVDIIDLQLDSSEPHPVIEAYIDNNQFAIASVMMSAAYNDVLDYAPVEATITLTTSNGDSEILQFNDSLGWYEGHRFRGKPNETYKLSIAMDTSTFEVESSLSSKLSIDSITCEYNEVLSLFNQSGSDENDPEDEFYDSLYDVRVYYTDIVDEDNYYLLRLAQNGGMILDYNLSDDRDDYGEVKFSLFIEGFALTDTVSAYLFSLDKGAYTYYQGLGDLGDSDIPYNPYTNIVGSTEVLGFFAARYVTKQHFILGDKAVFPSDEEELQAQERND